jgi:hypothetical protein
MLLLLPLPLLPQELVPLPLLTMTCLLLLRCCCCCRQDERKYKKKESQRQRKEEVRHHAVGITKPWNPQFETVLIHVPSTWPAKMAYPSITSMS